MRRLLLRAIAGALVEVLYVYPMGEGRSLLLYTHRNSKFRFSENILGPSLKITQSPILAILQYCCGLAQSQLPNMTPI